MIARKIDGSPISKAPPYAREIWLYLLRTANYKDNSVCKRGQTVRRYEDIKEALKWYIGYRKCTYSSAQCENSMKLLMRANMITKARTTRGLLITIVNYDTYQNAENYESHKESHNEKLARATALPDYKQECLKNDKNDKNNYDVFFEKFWSKYPKRSGKKVGKSDCFEWWKKEKPTEDILTAMLTWLETDSANRQLSEKAGQFYAAPCDPIRWLKKRRWRDEIEHIEPLNKNDGIANLERMFAEGRLEWKPPRQY